MKQYSFLILCGGFFMIMLLYPMETFVGASNGLLLWFQTILPTLLPFVILSNLLIRTNSVYYIAKLLAPLLRNFFCVSDYGCYAVLIGFLCGYPMGAKVIADLVSGKYISKTEGTYLLSFCNNTSPMFIVSYVVMQNLQSPALLLPSIFILFSSPILCSFLFRRVYCAHKKTDTISRSEKNKLSFEFQILDDAIMNGFETLTRVGGYIILFSILFSLCKKLPSAWILSFLEISNGIPFLTASALSDSFKYVTVLSLTSFGGLCAVAQTYSMIQETGLRILPYITQKLITAMVTSFLTILYLLFIH